MDDVEAMARIILRGPATVATIAAVGALLASTAWMQTRNRDWPTWRRLALGASGIAFAVLPATTLARPRNRIRWQIPDLGEALINLMHTNFLTPTPANVLNVAMLVPFGFLAALATQRIRWIVLGSCAGSVAVELIQGASGVGVTEIPDVLHNVSGAAAGAVVACLIGRGGLRAGHAAQN